MKGIGRIIGTIGWLLVIAGIGGPIFGLDGFNIFPGIALLFIGRVLGRQAKRREPVPEPERQPASEHLLNTERQRAARRPPRRQPPARMQSQPPPPPPPPPPERPGALEEIETPDRESILETILLAGGELAEETEVLGDDVGDTDTYKPMTSEEMIARARQRWDRKPEPPRSDATERR